MVWSGLRTMEKRREVKEREGERKRKRYNVVIVIFLLGAALNFVGNILNGRKSPSLSLSNIRNRKNPKNVDVHSRTRKEVRHYCMGTYPGSQALVAFDSL